MSDLPLVSIVVVSYNQGKYIRENLDSIKAQTYPNIELIVADDASPDDSVKIFNEWLAEHLYPAKRNFHDSNTGLAIVLNECVELVTGKYVKLIAADDFLHPESIEKCVKKLEEVGEKYGMVFTDTFALDIDTNSPTHYADYNSMYRDASQFGKILLEKNAIAALTVLMRRSVIIETGPYNSKYLVEDYHRWLMISQNYLIAYIPEKLAYYRLHNYNISKLKTDLINEEVLELRMLFDKDGFYKEEFLHYFLDYYSLKKKYSRRLFEAYMEYPFRSRSLSCTMKNRLPIKVYHILKRF